MKKIVLTLLFSLTLFANADSCKLDVYFGNGVWNDEWQAKISRDKLKTFMQLSDSSRFSVADEGNTYGFKYIHNISYGTINDLIETHWQLYESRQISTNYFTFVALTLDGIDNTGQISFRERMQNIISHYDDNVDTMLQTYRSSSFDKRHNILLVAHSQGNLFGNKIFELLTTEEKDKFRMVSVATPANNVTGDNSLAAPYTTLTGDIVIASIPDSLPSNAYGVGHKFVESYLHGSTSAANKIVTDIQSATDVLNQISCRRYLYFRWISYMCLNSTNHPTELVVDIMGAYQDGSLYNEEHVISDARIRRSVNGSCTLSGDDYRTATRNYDRDGCIAYTFDDTSGNYHTIDYIANQTYESRASCTTYNMNPSVANTLKALQN